MNKTSKLGQLTNFVFYTTLQLTFARLIFFPHCFLFCLRNFSPIASSARGGSALTFVDKFYSWATRRYVLQQCGYPCSLLL
jgi:hypothetical protein